METKLIEKCYPNEVFRKLGQKKVWLKSTYNFSTKRYTAQAYDDISEYTEIKKGTVVEVNFDF